MTEKTHASRRAFLKGAAIVAGPVGAAGAAAVVGLNEHEAKLQRLQAEAEVRALHQDWLRKVNTGDRTEAARLDKTVTGVAADHSGAPDEIALAADGASAKGRFHLVVETETERPLDSTLAKMAAAQGEGMIRSSDRKVVEAEYVKADAGWAIRRLTLKDA
jgi:hypothetical protein